MTTITLILPDDTPIIEIAKFAAARGCVLFTHADDVWEMRPGSVRLAPKADVIAFPSPVEHTRQEGDR